MTDRTLGRPDLAGGGGGGGYGNELPRRAEAGGQASLVQAAPGSRRDGLHPKWGQQCAAFPTL